SATWITMAPFLAWNGLPSISMVTRSSLISSSVGCFAGSGRIALLLLRAGTDHAAAVFDVIRELVAEMPYEAAHRHRGGIAERTDRVAFYLARDIVQLREILEPALAVLDARNHAVQP